MERIRTSWIGCVIKVALLREASLSIMDMEKVDDDDLVEEAYVYTTEKTYLDGCSANRKRVIRKKALKFHVGDNGELFYRYRTKGKVGHRY